jgi:endogenous inhibitor of DNA gyrase (YacG/DUF329 family)
MSEKTPATVKCPICNAPVVERYRPFCSERCADLDLGRWLKERYVLPGDERLPEPTDEDG